MTLMYMVARGLALSRKSLARNVRLKLYPSAVSIIVSLCALEVAGNG